MVSGASNHSGRNAPKGGLRAGMLIVIISMAGAFGTWIYKQVDLGPAGASAASLSDTPLPPDEVGDQMAASSTSSSQQSAPAARRSDVNHDAIRRAATPKQTAANTSKAPAKSKQPKQTSIVVKDSKRRFAVVAYEEGDKALSAGRHIEAIIAFDKAIELDPGYADAYYALGLAYIMAGDRRAAIEQLRRLREMDENLANLLANLLE